MEFLFVIYSILVLVMILIAAIFSAAEIGIITSSKAKLHNLIEQGNLSAKIVIKLNKQRENVIGAILLGNNFINIASSAIATSILIHYFGEEGVIYATIIMTILIIIFGEVLPKTYAVYHAEKVSLALAPFIQFTVKILSPITNTIQLIVNSILNILGVGKGNEENSFYEEMRNIINLHHNEGRVIKREKDMLGSILDLRETRISEVMTHRINIIMIDGSLPIEKIIDFVLRSSHTRVPVWKDKHDNIIGVIHLKSLINTLRINKDSKKITLESIMDEPLFSPETNSLSKQIFYFKKHKNHMALAIDEYGDLTGLVTLSDILEEIVGQIKDANEEQTISLKKINKNTYIFDGEMTIRDINRKLDWDLPDENAATIAGLAMHIAESIPNSGQILNLPNYVIKIVKKQGNQIKRIKISRINAKIMV